MAAQTIDMVKVSRLTKRMLKVLDREPETACEAACLQAYINVSPEVRTWAKEEQNLRGERLLIDLSFAAVEMVKKVGAMSLDELAAAQREDAARLAAFETAKGEAKDGDDNGANI